MMPRSTQRKGIRRESPATSIDGALDKLLDTSQLIEQRGAFKGSEAKRVSDAFKFLTSHFALQDMSTRQRNYLNFLQKVQEFGGASMVALSAAGLGASAVYCMTDRNRVGLPYKIRDRIEDLDHPTLQRLANEYSSSGHAGDVSNVNQPQEGMLKFCYRSLKHLN
jgi:hypothetical protein